MTGISWMDAFLFGIISAVSLPIGALLSFIWKPKAKVLAALMAFGGGALLAAVTIDLVSVSIEKGHFIVLAGGAALGGIFFFILNQIVNNKGGFLRKTGTSLMHLKKLHQRKLKNITKKISNVPLFNHLPAQEIQALIPYIIKRYYKTGKYLLHHDDPGDRLIILESGKVKLVDEDQNKTIDFADELILGEIELLTGKKHDYSVIATTDVTAYIILKTDFDRLVANSPLLASEVRNLSENKIHLLENKQIISSEQAEVWFSKALAHLDEKSHSITSTDIKEHAKGHSGVGLMIWLGILLDGIPESIVIGSNVLLNATLSLSLLAGLFLSNFPEALSSSVGLREQKFPAGKILIMWISIMIVTGLGAFAGNTLFENASPNLFALVDGLAAGAMLTMIAETMLPEAFHIGGSVTGLSTLAGFLVTILCKFI
ncbi:MAG: cyclic nucleotide-binding domain-containing protein [Bacteroidia bacterium]|nr:cyclic nucleotide-binding domain-containing protein [Bacteroidia bacterium]